MLGWPPTDLACLLWQDRACQAGGGPTAAAAGGSGDTRARALCGCARAPPEAPPQTLRLDLRAAGRLDGSFSLLLTTTTSRLRKQTRRSAARMQRAWAPRGRVYVCLSVASFA